MPICVISPARGRLSGSWEEGLSGAVGKNLPASAAERVCHKGKAQG